MGCLTTSETSQVRIECRQAWPCRKPVVWSSPLVLEGRSQSEVARYLRRLPGLDQSSLMARYQAEGEAAFEPRSRRPKYEPGRYRTGPVELIVRATHTTRGGRPRRRRRHHRLASSTPPPEHACRGPRSAAYLRRAGLVTPEPKKRPKSSYIRFEAASRTRPGNPTSPTTDSPAPTADPAPTSRSSPGSTTTPATPCTSPHTPDHRPRSCCPPSARPLTSTASPPRPSPTTAWSTPSGSPASAARRPQRLRARTTPTRHHPEELPTEPPDNLRQSRAVPADYEEVAARPTRPAADHQPSCRALLDPSSTSTTSTVPTAPCHTGPPRPRPTTPDPKPAPAPTGPPTPTTASATTRSTKPAPSPCASRGHLRHIGVGRTHAGTYVILLVQDLDVRVVHAATGELLRELTIDPTPRLPTHTPTTRTSHKNK